MKISIIIPMHNAEKYILSTLVSIKDQSFRDYECIIVNDGSTDNSLSVCKDWIKNDDRFKIYSKNNEGVSVARNFGLKKAQGDYIHFVDADDILSPSLYENLINNIEEEELIAFRLTKDRNLLNYQKDLHAQRATPIDVLSDDDIEGYTVTKFVKRNLALKYHFPRNVVKGEDIEWTCSLYQNFQTIKYLPYALYFYRIHTDNAVKKYINELRKIRKILKSGYRIKKMLKTFPNYSNSHFYKKMEYRNNWYKREYVLNIIFIKHWPEIRNILKGDKGKIHD